MEKKTHSHDKSQHSGLSRRGLLKGSGALVAAGGIAGVTELAEAKKPDAGGQDLAFVNGKIHTMDGSNSDRLAAIDQQWPLRQRWQRDRRGRRQQEGDQPQGEDGHPWVDRFTYAHRSCWQPARVPRVA